ncbi:MAG: hypothetical protein WKG07_18300 [Hymenobacter sp.]
MTAEDDRRYPRLGHDPEHANQQRGGAGLAHAAPHAGPTSPRCTPCCAACSAPMTFSALQVIGGLLTSSWLPVPGF